MNSLKKKLRDRRIILGQPKSTNLQTLKPPRKLSLLNSLRHGIIT
jgi:hypothetical protein